ncbi:MAG: hypothetical protein Q4A92_08810 [Corynebacterium sp.]|nr:hypothetical protein [Corynebacterium sp.]
MNAQKDDALRGVAKERRDLAASIFGFVFYIGLIVVKPLSSLFSQTIQHPVAGFIGDAATNGSIPIESLRTATVVMFAIASVITTSTLIFVAGALLLVANKALKGELFIPRNVTLLSASGIAMLIYFIGIFIERMAANATASQFGGTGWFAQDPWLDSSLFPTFIFITAIGLFAVVVRRGVKLQEDQEGLI